MHAGEKSQPQMNLTMFFRGEGRAKAAEQATYHPDVHVIFQKKSWADNYSTMDWINNVLTPYAEQTFNGEEFLLLQDSLYQQRRLVSILSNKMNH